jgi:hypothetical protein
VLDGCTTAEQFAKDACLAVDLSSPTVETDCADATFSVLGDSLGAGCTYYPGIVTNVTVIPYNPEEHQYVTEVGGICEKISFAANVSAPGAAVLVRYEDDRHYPVDKVVGAGSQDNEPSSRGCSGENCPTGDQTDPYHVKQRCPPGTVVTGVVMRSGDWLDSMQFVCTPIHLVSYKTERLRATDAAGAELDEAMANLGQNLGGLVNNLAGLGR